MALFKKKKKRTIKATENWKFYYTSFEETPMSIRMDFGLEAFKEFTFLKHTYIIDIEYEGKYTNGLPNKEASAWLYNIEDTMEERWSFHDFYLVGIITHQGKRRFVFMAKNELPWESICSKLMKRKKVNDYQIEIILNDMGSFYKDVLLPNIYESNWIQNHKICSSLEEQGEVFQVVRTIDFYAYFQSMEEAKGFVEKLKQKEEFTYIDISDAGRNKKQVYFTADQIPTLETITKLTNEIITLAKEFDGEFDGWGTTIHKG